MSEASAGEARQPLAIAGLAVLLHAFAREVDRALGLVLRAELEPAGVLREVARALAADGGSALARIAAWTAAGLLAWLLLAGVHARRERLSLARALGREAAALAPLFLRPAITLLALVSVVARPSYPYAFTLPVALTQDWGVAQDAAALAVLLALRAPLPRLPAPRAREVFLISFLAYALLTPAWARLWEGHPGNEPKYLRQAVALGHGLTFDAEGVSAAMEDLPTRPLLEGLGRAARTLVGESGRMLAAVVRGDAGRDAIRAQRVTRQTIRGKDGGIYYVLAPGPALLLAPALRVDRALNRARATKDGLAVTVLAWNALAALLVVALFQLVRDATGRPGLAATLAFAFGLVPPFLFYFFQFYPELVGALVLAVAFRVLALRPQALTRHPWLFGWLLAVLPWLHQKFLPLWLVLVVTAAIAALRIVRVAPGAEAAGLGGRDAFSASSHGFPLAVLAGLLVPQAVSLYLTALYNFAITGSVRPDALFLAWGPGGVSGARVGQGLLGLLLDARYGVLPYVPLLTIAAAGLARGGARGFAIVLPSALVYYLTVASADNWAGAVCNLGRYLMPLVPLLVALVGVALAGGRAHGPLGRGGVALVLALAAWTALFAHALWQDPIAANDSALLLVKSTYADASRYIPGLFIRHWHDAAPGLWARIAAWLLALGLLAALLGRIRSATRALVGLVAVTLAFGFALERWPGTQAAPRFGNALAAGADGLVFLEGAVAVREDEAVLGPGTVTLLRRSRGGDPGAVAFTPLRATLGGTGLLRVEGLPAITLRPAGAVVDLPFLAYHVVAGADGRSAAYSRLRASVSGQAVIRLAGDGMKLERMPATVSPATSDEDREPDGARLR